MTDQRDKPSRAADSVARTTARDVPFARGADAESESAPRGQRGQQLPRDPRGAIDPAEVELAVLREPYRRSADPSTRQGGRLAPRVAAEVTPESITPESPGAREAARAASPARSPEPPSSEARSVASGTLLSVGSVDPRGKTERSLETPRMFFSQAGAIAEAYFKPGAIPAVTVHETLETETIKLSDSVDPRRAVTLPRLDRVELARLADGAPPASEEPVALSNGAEVPVSEAERGWHEHEEPASYDFPPPDGRIHASLSAFRPIEERQDADFSLRGVSTQPEPFVVRRESEPAPAPSAVPTQRDLPGHRRVSSAPPPVAPASAPMAAEAAAALASAPTAAEPDSDARSSEGPSATTASIVAAEPQRRAYANYVAFLAALLLALLLGFIVMRKGEPASDERTPRPTLEAAPGLPASHAPAPTPLTATAPPFEAAPARRAAPTLEPAPPPPRSPNETSAAPRLAAPASKAPPAPAPASPPAAEPKPTKALPAKPQRETIF